MLNFRFDYKVYDDDTVTLVFDGIPIDKLGPVLHQIGGVMRQSIIDAVNAQKVANSMGIEWTQRTIHSRNGEIVYDD